MMERLRMHAWSVVRVRAVALCSWMAGGCLQIGYMPVLAQPALPLVAAAANDETEATVPSYSRIIIKDQRPPYRQFNGVEITGSSIVRKEQLQTLPVQSISRAEIEKSNKQDLGELLQALPVMFNGFSSGSLGLVQSGFSGAAIHGQQTGTLVLINGHRLANYGLQNNAGPDNGGIDVNALPLSAIERIEILTDGASSVYGTDAQSGVINIITRTERPGVEITAQQRLPDGQKGLGRRIDLSVGKGKLATDGYSWFIAADVQNQEELLGRDRPYASAGRYLVQQNGQNYWVYGSGLSAAQTSPTLSTSPSTKAPYGWLWNADYQNGQCANGNVPVWGQKACLYNSYQDKGLYPESKAARLHAQGQLQINPDITAFAELSLMQNEQRRSLVDWTPKVVQMNSMPGTRSYNYATAHGFDPAQGTYLLYSGSELGPLSVWYGLETRRMVAGFKGVWADWNFQTSVYYSDNQATYDSGRFSAYPSLDSTVLSPLSSDNPASQQLRQQLLGMVTPRVNQSRGINALQGVDIKGSRSIAEWDGRDVMLAWGTDLRQETTDFSSQVADQPSYAGQRKVWAQFAEIQMPLPYEAEALASVRNDHYSSFGNTTHAKLSAKWAPSSAWLLRAGWGSAFRAPAVAQMQETQPYQVAQTSYACTNALEKMASLLGGSCPAGPFGIYSQGSSTLKPELSTQWNLGARFVPDPNHTVSVDYWRLDMRNKINYANPDTVLSNPELHMDNFRLNANKELQLYLPMLNVGQTQTAGIDFSWQLRRPVSWGILTAAVTGTRLLVSRYQLQDGQPFVSDLNTRSYYYGGVVPKLKTQWQLGLQQSAWSWLAKVNHVGSHDSGRTAAIDANTGENVTLSGLHVPAWWTLDLLVSHQWSRQTTLRLGIDNLFNRQAPLDLGMSSSFNFGANTSLADIWGRVVHLSLIHRF